jgi:drug/metabolite transporter (DMT)-like permease
MPTGLLVAAYALLFSAVTVISILLTGARSFLSKETPSVAVAVWNLVWDWHFVVGAAFAFAARLCFILMNQALYRDPVLSRSSTTITTLVTSVSTIAVIAANVLILGERLTARQASGAAVVLGGILLLVAK